MTVRRIDGPTFCVGECDRVIADLWGTLHDSTSAYPDAVATLDALGATSLPVILLSNAPRPVSIEVECLGVFGIAPDL